MAAACRGLAIILAIGVAGVAHAQSSEPTPADASTSTSPAETVLQMPVDSASETYTFMRSFRSGGAFATATMLAVRPAAALLTFEDSLQLHGGFLSWTAAAQGEIGYRCTSDVSWLAAVQVVPVAGTATLLGLDLDRLSTNRSSNPLVDRRWEVGLRMMAIAAFDDFVPLGIGPHAGVNWHRLLGDPQFGVGRFTVDARADIGILFTRAVVPYVDLRTEVGLTYRPAEYPRMSISAGAYNEGAWFYLAGAMTPGVYLRLAWNY